MTLATLANHLNGSPIQPLVEAQLVKIAGADIRRSDLSPERRAWASNVLSAEGRVDSSRVMGMVLTNVTIAAKLEAGETPSDQEIEYVVVSEVLPLIAPS
ncbi:hypothetical protein WDJ50_02485 [Deinococcus sp. VB142]|uniref:Uncharacterized protein n=1 Tax=Deinococcus sp. VB142 TaxID=3112952 RepID=A0AAU6Q3R9_9DEIO